MFSTFLRLVISTQNFAPTLCRIAIGVVFLWIGLLKFVPYEADSIVPFVANSPFMSWLYNNPTEYAQFMNHEGQFNEVFRQWHIANNTYGYSNGLGVVEVAFALLILSNFFSPTLGFIGAFLSFLTPFLTYTFLIFTPETWVTNQEAGTYGFPYLSGAGRLVLKDIMMVACGLVAMIDSAKTILARKEAKQATA